MRVWMFRGVQEAGRRGTGFSESGLNRSDRCRNRSRRCRRCYRKTGRCVTPVVGPAKLVGLVKRREAFTVGAVGEPADAVQAPLGKRGAGQSSYKLATSRTRRSVSKATPS